MNALDIDLIRQSARERAPESRSTAHSLERMTNLQVARRTVIFTVGAGGIAELMDRARVDIPGLTTCKIFQAAVNHNPDIFWAIARKDRFDINDPKGEGFLAVLPLNHEGMRRLIDGRLNTKDPELCYVARQSERPAGIYVWAIHARGTLAAAIPLVLQKISSPLYQGVNLYSRPITKGGLRVLEPLGFHPGARYEELFAPHLQMFDRSKDLPQVKVVPRDPVTVEVVRSMDEMARVIAIRGAIYMAEQRCPFDEEFDGNDFSATHLICNKDGEPVLHAHSLFAASPSSRLAVGTKAAEGSPARSSRGDRAVPQEGLYGMRRPGCSVWVARLPAAGHPRFIFPISTMSRSSSRPRSIRKASRSTTILTCSFVPRAAGIRRASWKNP